MSILLEFSMFPTDRGESVSSEVSQVIQMIRDSGLAYRLTPMGTVIETERLDQALAVVQQAYEILDGLGCRRIYSSIKIDSRKERSARMQGKIDSIEQKIGEVTS